MQLTPRIKTAVGLALLWVGYRLLEVNFDKWLEKVGLAFVAAEGPSPSVVGWLMGIVDAYILPALAYLFGPFGLGFVIGAILFFPS